MIILSVWIAQYIHKKYNSLKRDIGGNSNIKWHTKVAFYYGIIGFSLTALGYLAYIIMYAIPTFDNDRDVMLVILQVLFGLFSIRDALFHPLSVLLLPAVNFTDMTGYAPELQQVCRFDRLALTMTGV